MLLLIRTFERIKELIKTMPMPIVEIKDNEIIVRNIDDTVGYVLENYTEEQLEELKSLVNFRIRNDREKVALEVLEEFLNDEIDLAGYDSFYQLYDYIEEEHDDIKTYGKLIMCVESYKVELDVAVDLISHDKYIYSAEDYQKCTVYSKQFLVEFIFQIINSVRLNYRCDKN